jgi:2-polyprenyl-3-methyl-5-hydroxy-6-metoxy-1,4-benzoquinol methylase
MVSIEQYYENYWDRPDEYNDPSTPARFALLKKHLAHLATGARIIDVGCGRGEFCGFFKQMGFASEGIDISENVIRYARERHPDIMFHNGEVQTLLPGNAKVFDAAFTSEVIEHLFDVEGYLKCVNQLIKPSGTLIVTTPYHGWLKNMVVDTLNYTKHYDPVGQHIRFFNKKGLEMVLRNSRFEPLVWTGYGRPWPMWKSFFVVARKVSDAQSEL